MSEIRLTNNSTVHPEDITKVERDDTGAFRVTLRGGTVRTVRDVQLTMVGRELLNRLYQRKG